jgi:hypothetical protein
MLRAGQSDKMCEKARHFGIFLCANRMRRPSKNEYRFIAGACAAHLSKAMQAGVVK